MASFMLEHRRLRSVSSLSTRLERILRRREIGHSSKTNPPLIYVYGYCVSGLEASLGRQNIGQRTNAPKCVPAVQQLV